MRSTTQEHCDTRQAQSWVCKDRLPLSCTGSRSTQILHHLNPLKRLVTYLGPKDELSRLLQRGYNDGSLHNSGTDVKTVRDAVILYIARKKQKGRSEQHIQDKLLQLEDKFKHIEMWHPAFRDARALFQLPSPNISHFLSPLSVNNMNPSCIQ